MKKVDKKIPTWVTVEAGNGSLIETKNMRSFPVEKPSKEKISREENPF